MTENGTEPNSSTAILSSKMSTAFNNVLDSSFSERNNSMGKVLFLRDDLNFFNKIVYRKKSLLMELSIDLVMSTKVRVILVDPIPLLVCLKKKIKTICLLILCTLHHMRNKHLQALYMLMA